MNILFFTHAEPKFLPPLILDADACLCGPHYNPLRQQGRWKYLNTPRGTFDASALISKLGPSQQPDLILVHADATRACLPQNLPPQVRKVLLVGGATHILKNPLQSMISYALEQEFETVVVWNRHNAHFFRQFGIPNVFWMPGLIFQIPKVQAARERRNQLCFFGQLGDYHPRRNRIIKELQRHKIPIVGGKLPRTQSLELAARSLVSLNISLNGELNLRVFESTAMGALLLTDRLTPHTGFDLLYQDGVSYLGYDDVEDLLQTIHELSRNPDGARQIAANGNAITTEHFSFEARRKAFFALLENHEAPSIFRLEDEPRCQLPPAESEYRDSLVFRLQLYELLQELHRTEESVRVHLSQSVHPLILSDAGDLKRLSQHLFIDPASFEDHWKSAMQELQVINLHTAEPAALSTTRSDVLITSIEDLHLPAVRQAIEDRNQRFLVISDWFTDPDARVERALVERAYIPHKERVFGLFEAASPDQ
ncbi:MAG: glycosyltransferase [Puniceicoccaceae bacterium]